jgi:hypothetical protein
MNFFHPTWDAALRTLAVRRAAVLDTKAKCRHLKKIDLLKVYFAAGVYQSL